MNKRLANIEQTQVAIKNDQAAQAAKLEQLIAEKTAISISKAHRSDWDRIRNALRIQLSLVACPPHSANTRIAAFIWTGEKEDAQFQRAIAYLTPLLRINDKPNLNLQLLPGSNQPLDNTPNEVLDMKIKGTTDLLICSDEFLVLENCRVIFELKKNLSDPVHRNNAVTQLRIQLVMAALFSWNPVVAVLTDLGNNWLLSWTSSPTSTAHACHFKFATVNHAATAIHLIREWLDLAPASSSSSKAGPAGAGGGGFFGDRSNRFQPHSSSAPPPASNSFAPPPSSSASSSRRGRQRQSTATTTDAAPPKVAEGIFAGACKMEFPIYVPEDVLRMDELVDEMTPKERREYAIYKTLKLLSLHPSFWGADVPIPPPFTTRCESPLPAESPPIVM